MKLKDYRNKRDFSKTNEPYGGKNADEKIFCVQFHEARRDHYDLRLEHGGVLLSWAVPKQPSFDPKQKRLAVKVEDHPIEYADFEGEIPKGEYGGGKVTIWDKGVYVPKNDFEDGLKKGSLKFSLFGSKLKGDWALVKLKDGDNWLLVKERDEFAESDCAERKPAAENLDFFELKQPTAAKELPFGGDWVFEIKYDGYRVVAVVTDGKTRLFTRNRVDVTKRFEGIRKALDMTLARRSAVLDGEIIALTDGKPNFGALQGEVKNAEINYVVFDLLSLDGTDMRKFDLSTRKRFLGELLEGAPKEIGQSVLFGDGRQLFRAVKKLGLEGVVCKKSTATYFEKDWFKVKCKARQEFIVCGFVSGEKEVSSLILGVNDGGLRYVGKVAVGGTKTANMLKSVLAPLATPKPTLATNVKGAHWVKPEIAAEVEFAEWTIGGKIRHGVFKGLRTDKDALSVKNEDPDSVMGITITHPQRLVFTAPDISKMQVARYYEKVCPLMLPYLKGRPVSIYRCNDGIENGFFKRHADGSKTEPIYIETERDIIRHVQLGAVEFHLQCGGKINFIVFDLDPDEDLSADKVRKGALDVRRILSSFGLRSFVKTSGGKGYHIFVPSGGVDPREFSRSVARLAEAKYPSLYTSNMKKSCRKGKIFIDWQRNGNGATVVAPYSLRARKGAPVSLPIPWSKLDEFTPNGANTETPVPKDAWRGFFDCN